MKTPVFISQTRRRDKLLMASRAQQSFFGLLVIFAIFILIVGFVIAQRNKNYRENFPETNRPTEFSAPTSTPLEEKIIIEEKTKEENVIIYTSDGFSPKILKVKRGTMVTFKNKNTDPLWPASAVHPTHNIYPIKGGCLASIFDACAEIKPQENWQFKFDVLGTWGYHDHLNPSNFGTVIVE